MKELGWLPNKKIVIKSDLDKVLSADEDLINLNLELGTLLDMVVFVESILKEISQRSFIVRNSLEYEKFINGVN